MSRSPHTCPTCSGTKRTAAGPCETCDASGVVWESTAEEAAAGAVSAESALDLTDYPA